MRTGARHQQQQIAEGAGLPTHIPTLDGWRALAIVAVICALAAWLLLRTVYEKLPPLPWTGVPALLVAAVAEAWTGRDLQNRIAGRRGLKPAAPLFVSRMVALAKATALVEAAPKTIPPYVVRGHIYSEMSQWDKADADYQTILQIDPHKSPPRQVRSAAARDHQVSPVADADRQRRSFEYHFQCVAERHVPSIMKDAIGDHAVH